MKLERTPDLLIHLLAPARMSSVARCYTPLKTNIYIKPKDQYEISRDSFEIGVFEASNYYSSIMEGTLADANNLDCVQGHGKEDHSIIKSHSINLVPSYKQEESKKNNKHKKLQPSSPGAKLASYLHSILSKPKRNKPVLFQDDRKSSRSSSLSLARCVNVAEAALVHSCPSYTSYTRRPTPMLTSAHARAVHTKPVYNELRSYSSCSSKQSLLDAETLVAGGRSWPAMTWFDQELKIRNELVSYNFKGLKKVKEEDGMESDSSSSSDLFELRNNDSKVQGRLGELPVHRTTNMNNIKSKK